jgi:REP element-mobilizing transposase RayT
MGYARKSLICLNDTPYYHVISRCVRRAWLWGVDEYAGKDYSHRKAWVLERLQVLSTAFAIDLCAYAVMSNHYHLVLHVDQARAQRLSQREIVDRWTRLFNAPELIRRWLTGVASVAEQRAAEQHIEGWRARLSDISCYMGCLNEHLARRANAEDQCTGRFWEGRFKSQAILDEAGLLTAMAYVDLNPVRAGIASIPEESEFTSVHARIQQLQPRRPSNSPATAGASAAVIVHLLACSDSAAPGEPAIPLPLHEYLKLVDWTGRAVRADKRGAIPGQVPPILTRLNIDPQAWQLLMRPAGNPFGRALGRLDRLRLHAKALGQSWVKGLNQAERLYRTKPA